MYARKDLIPPLLICSSRAAWIQAFLAVGAVCAPKGLEKHSPGFTLGSLLNTSCPEGAPETRGVRNTIFCRPFRAVPLEI